MEITKEIRKFLGKEARYNINHHGINPDQLPLLIAGREEQKSQYLKALMSERNLRRSRYFELSTSMLTRGIREAMSTGRPKL